MENKCKIEIATSDFLTTVSAVEGGADRIELCANLAEGGTTPSYGLMMMARNRFPNVEIFTMIRPRGGDFLYTDDEFEIMKADIQIAKSMGVDGVVFGILNTDGRIDLKRNAELVELSYPLGVTFHRAFDRCKDPYQALEDLKFIGCNRILTSGQTPNALDSLELIKHLNELAKNDIIIMPGSGINPTNVKMVKEFTGCKEFHGSLRAKKVSDMQFIHPNFKDDTGSYINNYINPEMVRDFKNAVS